MSKRQVQVAVTINLSPESVIKFVSDIRNRTKYLDALKSVSNIDGEPGEVTKSWNWKWEILGQEFEGNGTTVDYQPAQSYAFITEGDINSKFSYRAEPAGEGTSLTVDVEFEIPKEYVGRDDLGEILASLKQRGDQAVENLKTMMEQSEGS